MIKRLEYMKEALMNCIQDQLGDLSSVDTQELGAAVDMIKDLSEAVYYCTIVESMSEKEKGKETVMYYPMSMPIDGGGNRNMDYTMGRMYYDGSASYTQGGSGSNRNYRDGNRQSEGESRNFLQREYPVELRDYREGRSPMTRKNYMESKEMHRDKMSQMQELEKYMQELSQDLTEMIEGSSPEEKQMLQKKLSALATKIV